MKHRRRNSLFLSNKVLNGFPGHKKGTRVLFKSTATQSHSLTPAYVDSILIEKRKRFAGDMI